MTCIDQHSRECYVLNSEATFLFLQAVKTGDTIFIGQYLFTGKETTSVWLEVRPIDLIPCTKQSDTLPSWPFIDKLGTTIHCTLYCGNLLLLSIIALWLRNLNFFY